MGGRLGWSRSADVAACELWAAGDFRPSFLEHAGGHFDVSYSSMMLLQALIHRPRGFQWAHAQRRRAGGSLDTVMTMRKASDTNRWCHHIVSTCIKNVKGILSTRDVFKCSLEIDGRVYWNVPKGQQGTVVPRISGIS